MKNILITIILLSLPFSIFAKPFDWHGGGRVSYSLQKKYSPVVAKAVDIFSDDMEAITGKRPKSSGAGDILLYQLDKSSNKEMKVLKALKVPVLDFITKKDAYWIGVRNGKIVIAGSNGRGTAYGLLQLAKMPAAIDDKFETLQVPSVEYRGIALERTGDIDYHKFFELMLRYRANTLSQGWDEGETPSHFLHNLRNMAEEYGIVLATPHNGNGMRLVEHKSNKTINIVWHDDNYGYMESARDDNEEGGVVYHLSYSGQPHDYLWLCTTQPGLLVNEMKTAFYNGGNKLWMAVIHNPQVAAYHLSLFFDLAWNANSVKVTDVRRHLSDWLKKRYGKNIAESLTGSLVKYFQLVGIRRPEFMDFSRQNTASKHNGNGDGGVRNTEFNAEEFGNELERYLNDYGAVCKKVESAKIFVKDALKDDYFTTIEYPVYCSALMAVKTLQTQESRLISRPVSFHHDSEALESAVRSIKAYERIQKLTSLYNNIMAKEKSSWAMNAAPHRLAVFGKPVLTDTLSKAEIKEYGDYTVVDARLSDDNTIVRNAYEYTTASSGAKRIDMLGRSVKAVEMYSGDKLTFNFQSGIMGGVLRLAFIPTHALDGGSSQCSINIDGNDRTVIVTDGSHSDKWADNVLRGQSIITLPVSLAAGSHTLTITALSDHVILDQWMIDRDIDRHFYIMPVRESHYLFGME